MRGAGEWKNRRGSSPKRSTVAGGQCKGWAEVKPTVFDGGGECDRDAGTSASGSRGDPVGRPDAIESPAQIPHDRMVVLENLQIVFFFISGFLVSRVLIKVRLPQKLVRLLLGESHNSLSQTLLYLIGTAALMSFFIPNAITVLTLLPVLDLLSRAFRDNGDHRVPTLLTLAVLYGANIGGMGSVTGTPTNLLLVGYLQAQDVPGADQITYLSWLLWGVPLVAILTLLAWGVLCVSFRTWREDAARVHMPVAPEATEHPWQHRALGVTLAYLLSCILLSFLLTALPRWQTAILTASGAVTLGFIGYLFVPWARGEGPFLTGADTVSGLPKKGLEFLALVLVLGVLMYALNIQGWLAARAQSLIPEALPLLALLLIIALISSFATEIFSNTVVQLALFLVLLPVAEPWGFGPAQALLVVTLSCTCAFMSPIATPVNALAFGGMPGMLLWRWLTVGALMNAVAALAITVYVHAFIDFGPVG